MTEIYKYKDAVLPDGFRFPDDYFRFLSDGARKDLKPWWFLCDMPSVADFWLDDLERQYPGRRLIPFAKLEDSDDVACFDGFDTSGNPGVQYIHAFASVGWERRGTEDNFLGWLEQAKNDHCVYMAEREN